MQAVRWHIAAVQAGAGARGRHLWQMWLLPRGGGGGGDGGGREAVASRACRLTVCCSCFTDSCASAGEAKLRSLGAPPARAAEATTMVERRSTSRSFMVGEEGSAVECLGEQGEWNGVQRSRRRLNAPRTGSGQRPAGQQGGQTAAAPLCLLA